MIDHLGRELAIGVSVTAIDPTELHCGTGIYDHAVVVSVDPLILTSPQGDMRWDKMDPQKLIVGQKAPFFEFYAGVGRLACDCGYPNVCATKDQP